jgi:hypothetical protein
MAIDESFRHYAVNETGLKATGRNNWEPWILRWNVYGL